MLNAKIIAKRVVEKKATMPGKRYSFTVSELTRLIAAVQKDAIKSLWRE